jgi:hypothetical protein
MKNIIFLLFLVSLCSYADEKDEKDYGFTVDDCKKDDIQKAATKSFKDMGAIPPDNFAEDLYKTCIKMKSIVVSKCPNPNTSPGNIPLFQVIYPYKPLIGASVNIGSGKKQKTIKIQPYHAACGPSSSKIYYKGTKQGIGYTFTIENF